MLKIETTPSPILGKTARSVEKFDGKLIQTLKSMEETLLATKDPIRVGLAAPQVGLSLRIFLMRPTEKSRVRAFINPEITYISEKPSTVVAQSKDISKAKPKKESKNLLEGCLSMPNIWGHVTRKKEVRVSFQDEKGEKHEETFKDFPAVIVQHEIDHLNGILFTKHVIEQGENLYKSSKGKDGKEIYEEIDL